MEWPVIFTIFRYFQFIEFQVKFLAGHTTTLYGSTIQGTHCDTTDFNESCLTVEILRVEFGI